MTASASLQIQIWSIDRLVFYARNPRKNDAAVDRMVASIREFGFKIPVLARAETGKGSPRVLQRRRFIRDCPVGAVAAESFGRGNRCRVYRKRRTSPIPTSVKANRPPEGARVPEAQAEQQAASSRRE
jgi:hypothetical protein